MFDLDKWAEIFQAITRNKSRSMLTAFGIFWGIFMLILLMGGAKGMKSILQSTFDGFAQNSYMAFAGTTSKPYGGFQVGRSWQMSDDDILSVRRYVSHADIVTPLIAKWGGVFKFRDKTHDGTIKGVYPDYAAIENPKITHGRFIQSVDVRDFRKICIIGRKVATTLFPNQSNPIGKFINVNGVYFQVVGISGNTSKMAVGGNTENTIFVPYTTLQRLENRGREFDVLAVTAKPGYSVSSLQGQVEDLLKKNHHIAPEDKQAINGMNMEAMFQMVQSLFNGINILVWLIGIGTLISGSIGVSNIMMVVVKERTTEIGIRRAIGARPSTVLSQILTESMVLTLLAGFSGIVLAVLILAGAEIAMKSGAPSEFADAQFQISFVMALGASVALAVLGTTAGIAPALRALAIKPIDAIRDE